MSESEQHVSSEVTAVAPKETALDRIFGIFAAPVKTMKSIAAAPDWLVPLILVLVLSGAASFAASSNVDFESDMRAQMEKRFQEKGLPTDKIDDQVAMASKVSSVMFQWGWLISPIFMVGIAGVLLAAFNIMGGRARFGQAFSVTLYSWIPLTIRTLIGCAVVAMRSEPTRLMQLASASYSNPSPLVDIDKSKALFLFLSTLDVFTFWSLFLMAVGFSEASGLSRRKSAIILGVLWLLTVAARVVPTLITG